MKYHTTLPKFAAALLCAACLATLGQAAGDVRVTVLGSVEYNQINPPPLGDANPGDPAWLTFLLDSTNFVNNGTFPTRGYVIDASSFQLKLGTATMSLANPFPPGDVPYFVLRNNDPGVDGFFLSRDTAGPNGLPINQTGVFGPFFSQFSVTYGGSTLPSLNIFDALGTYNFAGLQVFNWTVDDGPFNPLGVIFASMQISCEVSSPANYCTALMSSSGCTPQIAATGQATLSNPTNLVVSGLNLEAGKNGLLFFGTTGPASQPFFGGTLCVNPVLYRMDIKSTGGAAACSGSFSYTLADYVAQPSGGPLVVPGAVIHSQIWFRDPAAAQTVGLTDGLVFSVCP